ncbi:MAG: hypothetical protein H0X73_09000 [Chthoniobacterales bacterium]|nr:hypothetical protein [Chthoniobacterales bacterium]
MTNRPLALCRFATFTIVAVGALVLLGAARELDAQDEPKLVPDVAEVGKLLPLLPDPPAGWTAETAEGSSDDLGDTKITTVHRDYQKGEADDAPTTSISILDSVANPEYVDMTTSGWTSDETTADGYTKSVDIDGVPGFETFENDGKHGALWLLVAKRYFLQIETTGQDPQELQEWRKRIDLTKLAGVK